MVKAVIISDTHIPKKAKTWPSELTNQLKNADLIIHAGDWQTMAVYNEFQKYGPVEGVYGNVDDEEVKGDLPAKKIIKFDKFHVGLVHGHEGKGRTTEQRAIRAFEDQKLDVLIFGHSHIPIKKQEAGLLIFNPGSPTDKRRNKQFSFGVLEVEGSQINLEHVWFGK